MTRGLGTLGLVLVLGAGCDDGTGIGGSTANLRFSPSEVDFGLRPVGERAELGLQIRNAGGGPVRILTAQFEPASRYLQVAPEAGGASVAGQRIDPGATLRAVVRYAPDQPGVHDVRLTLQTTSGMAELAIEAEAGRNPPERLILEPSALDLETVYVGETVVRPVSIRNTGSLASRLTRIRAPENFELVRPGGWDPTQALLLPDSQLDLELRHVPVTSGAIDAQVRIEVDGETELLLSVRSQVETPGRLTCPDEPVDLGRVARGFVAEDQIACRLEGGSARLQPVQPDLQPFVLGKPRFEGSILTIPVSVRGLGLPAPLERTFDLRTTDGQSEAIRLQAETVAPSAEDVELSVRAVWDDDFADLDLHLVRSGREPFAPRDDCYFLAKNPDWGFEGDAEDDPFLDRDSTTGEFPEEVNLGRARESRYDVFVFYHDYDPVVGNRPTQVFVSVQALGEELGRIDDELSTCGQILHVGTFERGGDGWAFQDVSERSTAYQSLAGARCR